MIILALGSNLQSKFGNRFQNIELAISKLKKNQIHIIKQSSFYETPCYPNKEDPKFINIVVEIKTDFSPEKLASILIKIEEELARKRKNKNDPRTIDIDILDFKQMAINFNYHNLKFIVPHKELSKRNFVLYPLIEILPEWKHPVSNCHIHLLIDNLSIEQKNSILKINKS